MEVVDASPDDYLAAFDDEATAEAMRHLDRIITRALPHRQRVLWRGVSWGGTDQAIIGCGRISQPRPRGPDVDWFLAGLARQKRSYSIYLNAVDDGEYLAHHFRERLGNVKLGAANISFRHPDHLDHDALAELLGRADALTPPDSS